MTFIFSILGTILFITNTSLVEFNKNYDMTQWRVVDDVVMGGKSGGRFYLNDKGNAVFTGLVSLENNGGFSSVRYQLKKRSVLNHEGFSLRVKGDGKAYQFRVKTDRYDRHSYIFDFKTNGNWQTLFIPFSEMYPAFRGMKLNMSNFPGETIGEIAFLIGNKKAEEFRIEIQNIDLK